MFLSACSLRTLALGGALAVLALSTGTGCSTGKQYEAKTFAVEGTLRYKDGADAADLGGGTLELESSSKTVIKVQIDSDGTFNRDEKFPPGKYRARIVPPPTAPDAEFDMDAKFKQFDSSGLTFTVSDETPQRVNLTLTRTPRKNRS